MFVSERFDAHIRLSSSEQHFNPIIYGVFFVRPFFTQRKKSMTTPSKEIVLLYFSANKFGFLIYLTSIMCHFINLVGFFASILAIDYWVYFATVP